MLFLIPCIYNCLTLLSDAGGWPESSKSARGWWGSQQGRHVKGGYLLRWWSPCRIIESWLCPFITGNLLHKIFLSSSFWVWLSDLSRVPSDLRVIAPGYCAAFVPLTTYLDYLNLSKLSVSCFPLRCVWLTLHIPTKCIQIVTKLEL